MQEIHCVKIKPVMMTSSSEQAQNQSPAWTKLFPAECENAFNLHLFVCEGFCRASNFTMTKTEMNSVLYHIPILK